MKTTIHLDDELLERAKRLTGLSRTSDVVRDALQALIAREAAMRLAKLGGSDPDAKVAARRRPA
ncbi:MAG: DUF2191 domain-containing protein [Phycisphaerae bacterium]|nr:DUF2191 domain-containing protein [Phycisphaerae bacterium]|tara:strand:+ start:44 stop:235 length:192 start_codon:yes stop_codon:yes gene_type:complete